MTSSIQNQAPEAEDRPVGAYQRAADWLQAYGTHLCAGDADAIAELFHPNGVVVPGPLADPIVGIDAIRDFYSEVFKAAEVHEILWSAPLYGGAQASAEWWADLTEDGKRAAEPGSLHFEVSEEGLCKSWRAYPFVGDDVRPVPQGWPQAIGQKHVD